MDVKGHITAFEATTASRSKNFDVTTDQEAQHAELTRQTQELFTQLVDGRPQIPVANAGVTIFQSIDMGTHEIEGVKQRVVVQPSIRADRQLGLDVVVPDQWPRGEGHLHYANSIQLCYEHTRLGEAVTLSSLANLQSFHELLTEVAHTAGVNPQVSATATA